jgi:hypothetical protein
MLLFPSSFPRGTQRKKTAITNLALKSKGTGVAPFMPSRFKRQENPSQKAETRARAHTHFLSLFSE